MANTIYKWRIWCNTDSKWVEGWDETQPTTCYENHTHLIDSTKTSSIDILTDTMPLSDAGSKLMVHATPRPITNNNKLFSYWTGAGDDCTNHIIGGGAPAIFSLTPFVPSQSVDIEFDGVFGDVYIHEGYFLWCNAGIGDYVISEVIAKPSPIATYAPHKDLVLDSNNYALYSTSGAGTGTHGFVGSPHLLPRTFSKDGDWNYNGVSLTPNFTKTGDYKICTVEHTIHRFMNKVMLVGSSNSYLRMVSAESTQIYPGYIVRITCVNVSNTTWNGAAMITAFRDSTAKP